MIEKTPKQIFHEELRKHDSTTDAFIEANKKWLEQKRQRLKNRDSERFVADIIAQYIKNELIKELKE